MKRHGTVTAAGRTLSTSLARLTAAFRRDTSGSYSLVFAFLSPVIIGFLGLSVDVGMWFSKQALLQAAADSSAFSAAAAKAAGATDYQTQAAGVAASYGFIANTNGVTLTVNSPPQSGSNTSLSKAVEVTITQAQTPYFAGMFMSNPIPVIGRAVSVAGTPAKPCILALEVSNTAISTTGYGLINNPSCPIVSNSSTSSSIVLTGSSMIKASSVSTVGAIIGQSNITATSGVYTGASAMADPYSAINYPSFSGCSHGTNTATTYYPGVYCSGLAITSGSVTLQPGVYYIDQGSFSVSGTSSVTGNGVTIVLTSSTGSNHAAISFSGYAAVSLTAPTSGPTAGIVVFGDRNSPANNNIAISGNAVTSFTGAVYATKYTVNYNNYASNGSSCTSYVVENLMVFGNSVVQACGSSSATPSSVVE